MDFIVFGTSRTRRTPGPRVHINCSACHAGTHAESFETEEWIRLFFVVPLPTQRERHVVCVACGEDRLIDLPLSTLAALGPEEVARHLYPRVSPIAKAIAVISVVLFVFPFVSLFLGAVAMFMTRRSRGWPFRAGMVAATLNILLWGGLLLRSALVELRVL